MRAVFHSRSTQFVLLNFTLGEFNCNVLFIERKPQHRAEHWSGKAFTILARLLITTLLLSPGATPTPLHESVSNLECTFDKE